MQKINRSTLQYVLKSISVYILLLILKIPSNHALANTGELLGFGSSSISLGNSMLGSKDQAFAGYYNPAMPASIEGLALSFGISWANPSFLEIDNVVTANSVTTAATTTQTLGKVDTDNYLDHLSQTLGVSFNFGERLYHLTLHAVASIPIARLAYIDSSDPFLPDYFNYRSRIQRPQIFAGFALKPLSYFHVGAGLAFSTNLSAANDVTISTVNNTVSHQRFASTIKPGATGYFGLYLDPKPFYSGLTVRMTNKYKVDIDTNARSRLFETLNEVPFVLNSSSAVYYDPFEVNLAVGADITPKTFVTGELDWLNYENFETPVLNVVFKRGSNSSIQNSVNTAPKTKNIFIGKLGVEQKINTIALRGGYMYRPSPIESNSGSGNLIDPDRHTFALGAGFDLKELGVVNHPVTVDTHITYHYFVRQTVTKTAGNELNQTGSKVGSPSYDIGGSMWGAGLSLSTKF